MLHAYCTRPRDGPRWTPRVLVRRTILHSAPPSAAPPGRTSENLKTVRLRRRDIKAAVCLACRREPLR